MVPEHPKQGMYNRCLQALNIRFMTDLNKIPYSILELAVVTKNNSVKQVLDNSLDLAQQAEAMGYTRFWLAEHHNMVHIASAATSVLIAYIVEGTSRIRVGSGGIMLPNHSPLIVSEQFGTLGTLYPDRIDLGLGRAPGTDQATAQAIRSDRVKSVVKFPEEIKQIRKYFSVENAQNEVRVALAEGVKVPVYVLGSSTDSAHVAADQGLPYVFASHFASAQLHEALDIYRNNFKPSGFLEEPYTIAGVNIMAADTIDEAKKISTSFIRMVVGIMTGKMDYMQPPEDFTDEYREIIAHPGLRNMLRYAFIGDAETVRSGIKGFVTETGIDEVMAVSHIYDHKDRVRSFKIFSEIMKGDV